MLISERLNLERGSECAKETLASPDIIFSITLFLIRPLGHADNIAPLIITVEIKGSITKPLPKDRIKIIISTKPPPKPPSSSEKGKDNQPNSEKFFHTDKSEPILFFIVFLLVSES